MGFQFLSGEDTGTLLTSFKHTYLPVTENYLHNQLQATNLNRKFDLIENCFFQIFT
jgi:hypothetical protein